MAADSATEKEKLQEETLNKCHDLLRKKLNVNAIISLLNGKNLLTPGDRHFLTEGHRSKEEKVDFIIDILPSKGTGWWNKFILSLKESTAGTAHDYVASLLEHHLKRKVYDETGQYTGGSPYQDGGLLHRKRGMSIHVPSGIALAMHDYVPDYDYEPLETATSELTLVTPYSDSITSTELRQDLAHIISPIVELKDKLDSVERCYNVMCKQVGLLQVCELLTEKTEMFGKALSNLIRLYIDKFKAKKQKGYSNLSAVESNVTRIIEDIAECTEDIDIEKEMQTWSQCVEKMKKNLGILKEALYSQNTAKMAKLQDAWRLKDTAAENAKLWIVERKEVIVTGNKYLTELNELRSQDSALISSVYDTIHTRVKTGEICLDAWINWIEQRINL